MTVILMVWTIMASSGAEVERFTDLETCETARATYQEMANKHRYFPSDYRCVAGVLKPKPNIRR